MAVAPGGSVRSTPRTRTPGRGRTPEATTALVGPRRRGARAPARSPVVALISLGESKWRMVRRVLKKKRFAYADCRNGTRHDEEHFDWLVANGFFVAAGD